MSAAFSYDCERAFDLLGRIGFVRMAGTPAEEKAADLLCAELADAGLTAEREAFAITDAAANTATLEVLEPYQASYTVTAYKNSGCTPEGGLTADFLYAEDATEADLVDARGKVVLVNQYLRLPLYKKLLEAGVAGFITMDGSMRDTPEDSDLFTRSLRANLRALGEALPGVNLRIADAFDLVRRKASKVRLVVHSQMVNATSHNVVATVPGTQPGKEFVVLGAHYDSVEFSTGVYDNGAGSVILMELARWFAAHPPRRTMRFVWFGAEEIGLEGSRAYVRDHEKELADCRMMFNVDVAAPVLGMEYLCMTAEEGFRAFTEGLMKLRGYRVQVTRGISSTDSVPFADKGIPCASFWRGAAPGGAFMHNRHDVLDYLSADALQKTTLYMMDFADTLANAVVFPFARSVPQDLHEQIDNYFFRKEVEEAEKKREEKEKEAAESRD